MHEQETAKALQYLQAVLRHDPLCGDGYCHYCDADIPPEEPRPLHAEGCLWTAIHQFLARLGLLPLACLVLFIVGCETQIRWESKPTPHTFFGIDLADWQVLNCSMRGQHPQTLSEEDSPLIFTAECLVAPIEEGRLWVSPTGRDTAACTVRDPCSLPTALAKVQPGETVLFFPGTYAKEITQ